jgi:DNA-binding PadR family transcriptional regulator
MDRPLNATAASLLGFLQEGPMTGWDLVSTARHWIADFWTLTQSQVYRELAAMADAGLVEAGERGRRDRQPFRITEAGKAAFAAWVDQEPGLETIRFPLLLTIQFGRHLPPGRLAAFVEHHRVMHRARLANYERHLEGDGAADGHDHPDVRPDPYRLATLQFGLAYERAVLTWFDELPPEIQGPARGTSE